MISNFDEILNHILGAIFIVLVFALAYAYLKPHRMHKKRPLSTLLLKASYLGYLLILMLVIYFSTLSREGLDVVFQGIEFFAFLIVLFGPTIGILARKLGPFNRRRDNYNWFFTLINFLSIAALILMYIF
jgi:hypothetical protein